MLEGTDVGGYPVYKEMTKFNSSNDYEIVVPAEIKYCKGIKAWVLVHKDIQKHPEADTEGCNWLLRSEETVEYDLLKVDTTWQIWNGVVGNTLISYTCNNCDSRTDCNYNGECGGDGKCACDAKDDEKYLGTHCEFKFKKECETIKGEADNTTFAVKFLDLEQNQFAQQYGRPIYAPLNATKRYGDVVTLSYTGDRWFLQGFTLEERNSTVEETIQSIVETHAFWGRDYDDRFTKLLSDGTKKATPVGVDFYLIGEQGDQFGPYGALSPIQVNGQVGRGYFRCAGPAPPPTNFTLSDLLQLGMQQQGKGGF